jgi:hypothetical protein
MPDENSAAVSTKVDVDVCRSALRWAEERGYAGFDKFDALNSPLLRALAGGSRILRGGFTYLVSRAPVNVRPFLGVKQSQNPKSLALFARSYLSLHTVTLDEPCLRKGLVLLERLLELSQAHRFSGHCWGAEYPRQSTKFYAEAHSPGAVITAEVAQAFLDAYEETGDRRYLEVAGSAADFITSDLVAVEESGAEICFSYIPDSSWKVVNANAKTAGLLARLAAIGRNPTLGSLARRNMAWVVARQTSMGAWFYADPPSASHVSHDNYHTGFVLSSLLEYINVTGEDAWEEAYLNGLEFYERELFLRDGAPKWRSDVVYPMDIHGAAQGILNFALAAARWPEKLDMAERIAAWAIGYMFDREGRFYYQKGPLWIKRYTLMRWCQAWMCYALAVSATAHTRGR